MDENMADELVLVTGASGYIAMHIVQLLQKQGYCVRGTVRSLKDETKVKPLRELCPDAKHPLELVEADLLDDESWIPAVKGCKYVIHTASPLPAEEPSNEDEVIKPAVNGTLAVMKACDEGVKRFVLTSSSITVTAGREEIDKACTEEDWGDLNKAIGAYARSKVLAEKAAWDYVKNLAEEERFELVVLNPAYVIGPVLCGGFAAAMNVPKWLLQREMPALANVGTGIVDIRDVALAHVNAITIPDAAGHRHLLVTNMFTSKDMAVVLDEEFRPQGYNVPLVEVPNFIVWIASFFDKRLGIILPSLGARPKHDNTRMKSVLGISPRDVKASLIDMAYSMIELGHIKKTAKYTGPRYSE